MAASSSAAAARASAARAASPAADSIADAASSSSSSSLAAAAARLSGESSIDDALDRLEALVSTVGGFVFFVFVGFLFLFFVPEERGGNGIRGSAIVAKSVRRRTVAVWIGESHATPPRSDVDVLGGETQAGGEGLVRRILVATRLHRRVRPDRPRGAPRARPLLLLLLSSVSVSDPPSSSSSSRWVRDEASASRSSRLSATPFAPAAPALASQLSIGSTKAAATPVPSISASPDSVSDSISADSSSSLARSSSLSAAAAAASGESSTFIADSRIDASSDKTSDKTPFGVGVDANGFIDDEENDDDDRAEDISAERFASDDAAGGGGGLNVNSSEDRLESASSRDERGPFDDAAQIGGVGGTFSSGDPRVGDLDPFSSSPPPRTVPPVGPAGVPYSRRAASAVVFTAFHRASAAALSAATLALDFSISSTFAGASPTVRSSTAVRSFHPG